MHAQDGSVTQQVAPYGVADCNSLGRSHEESALPWLSPFEFDLRRILTCSAFRRLQYKTQVFVCPRGDHSRTRLTHSLEVASIARLLARALHVNVGLAEAIALAHDLGHPPFGHAGEGALNYLMREHGSFEHNAQSLRVVDYLEHPFPPFRGLNLTYEVREALAKHRTGFDHPAQIQSDDEFLVELVGRGAQTTIEGQLVSIADTLAYDCHDLEDALGAELLEGSQLAEVRIWEEAAKKVKEAYPKRSLFAIWRTILESMQRRLLDDVVNATIQRIGDHRITSPDQARQHSSFLVGFSDPVRQQVEELEDFLQENVYRHPSMRKMDEMAGRLLAELFNTYVGQPNYLPQRFYDRIEEQGVHKVVCDYIAGMTDRFCENEYRRIFLPFSR